MNHRIRKSARRENLSRSDGSAGLTTGWLSLGGGLLATFAVLLGVFEDTAGARFGLPLLALMVAGSASEMAWRRRGPREPPGWPRQTAGPLWWLVAVWSVSRLLLPLGGQAILLPAALSAWLIAVYPLRISLLPLAAGLAIEIGLAAQGYQSWASTALNLGGCGIAMAAFNLYARSRVYRRRVRKAMDRARQAARQQEYALDLGLGDQAYLGELPEAQPRGRSVVEEIATSFDLQLQLLRSTLQLTTVAVLWPAAEDRELRLRSVATSRPDLLPGPYPTGAGIAGALRRTDPVMLAPIRPDYQGIPYYRAAQGVGSLLACRIPGTPPGPEKMPGFLCVDRVSTTPWNEEEIRVLQQAARKISLEVSMGRRLRKMDQERQAVRQIYLGLRELNAVLGLEPVCSASIRVVNRLLPADFCAIGLLEEERHRLEYAAGLDAEKWLGLEFTRHEGLCGQVLKAKRSLPSGGAYPGPAPVFSNEQRLTPFGSLLILPLCKEDGEAIGTLTVAATAPDIFTDARRQVLEMVASQVAIKIDLARSHERINSLAITDGLTGLANHRALQHGLDNMLYRAERQQSPLCVLLGDLDHFKQINDTHGHPFGDQVLKEVAAILAGATRRMDLAARYGGEEFAIILENSDAQTGLLTAERIRSRLENLVLRHGREPVQVTMSMGLTVYPEDGTEKSLLIERADQALYQAKQNGRNQVVAWRAAAA